MRRLIVYIFLSFCVLSMKGQIYGDSVLHLYTFFNPDSLQEKKRLVLEKYRPVFEENKSDTAVLSSLLYVAITGDHPELDFLFNELAVRICEKYLAEDLGAEERRFFLQKKGNTLVNKSIFLSGKDSLSKILEYKYEAIGISTQIKDTAAIITQVSDLGVLYFNHNKFDQAQKWWKSVLDLCQIQNDSACVLKHYFFLGAVLVKQQKGREAISYMERYLKFTEGSPPGVGPAMVREGMGNAYQQLGMLDSAAWYFEESYKICQEIEAERAYTGILNSLTQIAMLQGDLSKAKKYAEQCYKLAQKYKNAHFMRDATQVLYQVYQREGNYKKGMEMLLTYYDLKDSIQSASNFMALTEKEYQYEYRRKAELDSLANAQVLALEREEKKRQETTSFLLLGLLLLGLVFALILYNRFRITQKQRNQLDSANSKLKELDQSKSRFFTNISHEFRTPLTVISGMADMINDSEPRELIKRNSKSLLGLVNQILDLRKLESGKLPLNLQQANIIPYLQYLLESFQSFAESKGVTLRFSTEDQEVIMDYDTEKVYSIITNLISNAITFTPEGGEVSLQCSVGNIQSKELPTANSLQMTVSDNGIGIPKEKLTNIFDRFYQVDDSSTREGEGTGIGLTLTRELVKVLGGDITVASELEKGTTFQVHLPITQLAPKAAAETTRVRDGFPAPLADELEEIPAGSSDAFKLLIVEDNADVIRYLQVCLKDAYQISIAKDGQEGIEKAIAEVPDIIISDVMMPRKDGFELCQTLKTDERTSHIPIILLTAKVDVQSRISGLKRGADAYLAKPFYKEELLTRLEMLIKLRQQLQTRYQHIEELEPAKDSGIQMEDAFIQKLNAQIFEHLADSTINVQTLCEWVGMSRTQLHHKIKALTGRSASNYLRFIRMSEAKKMLKETDNTISEIAYTVGFSDPAYFSRSFAKEFGSAPSEIRKQA